MRFKMDENLPVEVAEMFRQAGHDATTISDQNLSGEPDAGLATVCQQERRSVVTLDTDFADIRAYPPDEYFGIIVLRLRRQDKSSVLEVIPDLINMLRQEPLKGHLWIVESDQIRIRG